MAGIRRGAAPLDAAVPRTLPGIRPLQAACVEFAVSRISYRAAGFILALLAAAPAAAQQRSTGAESSFLSLKAELEVMQAQTRDGRVQRLMLTGEPCRPTLTVAMTGNEIQRPWDDEIEWSWTESEEPVSSSIRPGVLMEDSDGELDLEMDTAARAERVVELMMALRRQCRGH